MAVTLTVQTLAARLRLTDGTAPPPEPQNSILTDMLEAATEIVTAYSPAAPDSIHNVAAGAIAGYLFEAPVGDGARFANALSNSGAEALLYRWKSQRVAIVGDDGDTSPSIGGLRRLGSDMVNVAMTRTWTLTALQVPTNAVIGVEILFPDGSTTGIELFANTLPGDAPVIVGDADGAQSEFSVGRTSGNRVTLASSQAGTHKITIWTVG